MNNQLSLTTQDVRKDFMGANSRNISKDFKKRHADVIRSIENLITQNCTVKKMFKLNSYISERGREEKEYIMNRDGFSLLAMGFTGKEALEWKLKYINYFNLMENELKARTETRYIGITVRKDLQDTIKKCVTDENSNFKKFAYGNYTRLVYKKVLGMDVKKFKELNKLTEKQNVRDFLSIEQLKEVQDIESKIATFIELTDNSNKTDKEVYADLKSYIEK